ncbi:MAG: PEP/pyruvate-binding domain-containing protein [Mangrovibacterium sp.]
MDRQLRNLSLDAIYKNRKSDRDIFEDLMPHRVKDVLLVATLYDSYSIVREGQFVDKIFGEFLQLNLFTYPRFTSVNTEEQAHREMKRKHFDMVIIMVGHDKQKPLDLADDLHAKNNTLPIVLLVNNNSDLRNFHETAKNRPSIDRVFVWNGNSNVFLAMIKYVEDKVNVESDTKMGNVRVILLVEDSVQYYSRYLPLLYTSVMKQTQDIAVGDKSDELNLILKMRARPKVLLASNYEDAVDLIDRYQKYLITVISDVTFEHNGVIIEEAGVELLNYVKHRLQYRIPIMLQSSDVENEEKAKKIGAEFINKNSERLAREIHSFIIRRLGFGNFVFKDSEGNPLMDAETVQQFEDMLMLIPDESIRYHARHNSFSTWLMARGEITLAERLRPYRFDDFDDVMKLREFCVDAFREARLDKLKGTVVNFNRKLLENNRYIVRMGKGSLGGKGRGLAFVCNFIANIQFKEIIPELNIRIPATAIVGASEMANFIEQNELEELIFRESNHQLIQQKFVESELSPSLRAKLWDYVRTIKKPLAVRSSGLFEDSLIQPFAGVYATYLIPNNDPDIEVRYAQLETAVKLVYASMFTESALSYFEAVDHKVEEESMAVIVQELVGHEYHERFYPTISGVAQSYNFYPVSNMQPDDGFAIMALGLGKYVVGGEAAHRFCPKYPKVNHSSLSDQVRDSQREFYALDMRNSQPDLIKGGEDAGVVRLNWKDAEEDGTLSPVAVVYDRENDDLIPDLSLRGTRVLNFDNLLKYDMLPLADTIDFLLRIFREAMGSPVEMEFAIDLDAGERGVPTFYILQIKPLIRNDQQMHIELNSSNNTDVLMYAKNGMGNGQIEGIRDVILVSSAHFNKMKTEQIAQEVNYFNKKFANAEYILVGPGRWGTRDPHTGIPVVWSEISRARVIVELGMPDFPLEGSLGSHFFHNVTSMNVGYFSIPYEKKDSFFNEELLRDCADLIEATEFVAHYRFKHDLTVLMDGRKREALIGISANLKNEDVR